MVRDELDPTVAFEYLLREVSVPTGIATSKASRPPGLTTSSQTVSAWTPGPSLTRVTRTVSVQAL